MKQAFENRQSVLQELSGEVALNRLAELATEFGADQIASTARNTAERISEVRFYVACIGQFKRRVERRMIMECRIPCDSQGCGF